MTVDGLPFLSFKDALDTALEKVNGGKAPRHRNYENAADCRAQERLGRSCPICQEAQERSSKDTRGG